jgi:hypothetical protein
VLCSGSPIGLSKQDETPAEKRARAALDKAREREVQKRAEVHIKLSEAILGKIGPVIVSLSSLLSKPEMEMVAGIIRDPITESLEAFEAMDIAAKAVIANNGEGELEVTDMKDPLCTCEFNINL